MYILWSDGHRDWEKSKGSSIITELTDTLFFCGEDKLGDLSYNTHCFKFNHYSKYTRKYCNEKTLNRYNYVYLNSVSKIDDIL